jgi:hypothetical protein
VLAGASYHGVAVNACVGDAARVARAVLARVGAVTGALALLAVTSALALPALAACSGGGPGSRSAPPVGRRDAGDAGLAAVGPPVVGAAPVEVRVVWPKPDAALLRAPGRNACGRLRPAPVPVGPEGVIADRHATERMIAVSGAVVTIDAAGGGGDAAGGAVAADAPAELALRDCAFTPRVVSVAGAGRALAVVNDDERRHEVKLEYADGAGEPIASVALPVVGRRIEVALPRAGVVRAVSAADPDDPAYAIVAGAGRAGVTDEAGGVRFDDVPPGTYAVEVWYPPVAAGGPAVTAATEVVVAGTPVKTRVALGP